MSVGSGTPYNIHTGNGVTVTFAYGFTLLDAADLAVTIDGVPSSAYTIAGIGNPSGGSVIFSSPPSSGAEVILALDITLERVADYQSNGDLLAATLNADFDRLWQALILKNDATTRTLRAPFPETMDELPAAEDRALSFLAFNASGQPTVGVPSSGSVLDFALSLLSTLGATLVGWIQAGVGAIARTVQDKLRESVSVKDFGAVGDASTDDTVPIQRAVAYAILNRKNLVFPAGEYKMTAVAAVTGSLGLRGDAQGISRILCVNTNAFDVSPGVSLFTVKGLTIANASRYTVTPNTNTAISINGTTASQCYWHSFEDLFIDGFQVGIYAGGLCSSSFRNVTTVYTYQSVNFAAQCLNNTISGCRFGEDLVSTAGGYGVKVGDGSINCEGLFITDTLIYGTHQGIVVNGSINVVARGNILDMIRQVGILSQSTASAGSINHTFTENYIGVIGAAGEEGIYLANAYAPADAQNRGNVVRDNEIIAYTGATLNYGILVDGAEEERNAISGNRVQNTVVFDARIVTGSGHRLSDNLWRSTNGFSTTVPVKYASTNVGAVSAPIMVYSASMTPDMSLNHSFDVTATNGTAFTINAPTNDSLRNTVDWDLRITIRNSSGGALGAATWNATYKMAAWTNPANGFSRSITFRWNGTNYVEVARTPADIPN